MLLFRNQAVAGSHTRHWVLLSGYTGREIICRPLREQDVGPPPQQMPPTQPSSMLLGSVTAPRQPLPVLGSLAFGTVDPEDFDPEGSAAAADKENTMTSSREATKEHQATPPTSRHQQEPCRHHQPPSPLPKSVSSKRRAGNATPGATQGASQAAQSNHI